MIIVPVLSVEIICFPLWLKIVELMSAVWPIKVCISFPVSTSHTLTVMSLEVETKYFPSLSKEIDFTSSVR